MREKAALLRLKLSGVLPYLNEKQRRILIAAEAKEWGWGGTETLANITGISRPTIRRGLRELRKKKTIATGVRKHGGGRKRLTAKNPKLVREIERLVEPSTRGDPGSPLRWTCKSVRNLSGALKKSGFEISYRSVANILHELEFSLQGNKKTKEGKDHPDRDKQFLYINKQVKRSLLSGTPVISVDTKKKELVGNYKNVGQEWEKKGRPHEVKGHDFPDPKVPKAIPYGVYDIGENKGWVNVGINADTAQFAVESIRYWWKKMGKRRYPKSKVLLICADSGGSNGYRSHLWKSELQNFSNQERFKIMVCHFPPGTSKWNKIEHRLFSFITTNWRGKPLTSYKTIVELIAATRTKTGLTVKVRLDKKKYEKGIVVPKKIIEQLNLERQTFHGEWNYTLSPND